MNVASWSEPRSSQVEAGECRVGAEGFKCVSAGEGEWGCTWEAEVKGWQTEWPDASVQEEGKTGGGGQC